MIDSNRNRPRWAVPAAALALAFGIATVYSGANVLFGDDAARRAAGDYVGWLVWFNTLAGFAYVVAAGGLWRWTRWAAWLSASIAVATLAAFLAFGMHAWAGGPVEARTVGAMTLRSGFWILLAVLSRPQLRRR